MGNLPPVAPTPSFTVEMSVAAMVKSAVPNLANVLMPETFLKKRKSDAKVREEKQSKAAELRKARKQKRQVIFKRAEQYVKEYKATEREQIRLRRLAKSQGDFFVPTQPRVAFVIRLRGISNIPPKPRKIMQLLRLRQINNGVLVCVCMVGVCWCVLLCVGVCVLVCVCWCVCVCVFV